MASQNTPESTGATVEQEVLSAEKPVLRACWADRAEPCKMLAPTIDQVAEEFAGKAKVGKLDTDSNREVSVKYGITAIPTVIVFKGGEAVKKFVGLTSRSELAAALADASE